MEKLVVTGGCGFIGSNFIRMILEKEPTVEVINFDLLTYAGNLANLKDLEKNPRLKFFKGDIANKQDVDAVLKDGVSSVVHFAAESHVDRSFKNSILFTKTNTLGAHIFIQKCFENNVKKLMFNPIARGISPKMVVIAVSKTGRKRAFPAFTTVSNKLSNGK